MPALKSPPRPDREPPAKCPRCGRKSLPTVFTTDPVNGRRVRFCVRCKHPFAAPSDDRV